MALLRVRRTWWIAQQMQPEAPLFRELSRRWRPVDQRERRLAPFALALSAPPPEKKKTGASKRSRLAELAEQLKKSRATWNPWRMTK